MSLGNRLGMIVGVVAIVAIVASVASVGIMTSVATAQGRGPDWG